MTLFGRISEIWRYPVSSMTGERLEEARLEERGVVGDRLWGVADLRNGEVAGPERRKHWRKLPLLASRLGVRGPEIAARGGAWLEAGSAEADALASRHLGFPAALRPHVPFGMEQDGHIAPRYRRADLHVLTTASMRTLAGLVSDPAQVDPRRFRPNVVIETEPSFTGFAEAGIVGRRLKLGEAAITVSEPCARCAFTVLAQEGLAFEREILGNIARHGEGGFGVLCRIDIPAPIRVGDEVRPIDA